jgi:hypothetical protein
LGADGAVEFEGEDEEDQDEELLNADAAHINV